MRSVLVLLMTALSIECARLSEAAQCPPDNHPAVTVQLRDYAHMKSESLSKAKEIVTRVYKNVGVGIEWLAYTPPDQRKAGQEASPGQIAQLTINILTPAMAARGGVPDNVLGFVAVPAEGGMGRIGYVVYEPIRQVAAAGPVSEGEVLGLVVAHDIGRLILGAGSQSSDGVMKGAWGRRDLEQVNPLELQFSPAEIAQLRTNLENNPESPSVVGTSGTRGSESRGCVAQ